MDTLQIDTILLRKAEQQARLRNINLSEAVEAFIRHFISQNSDEDPTVKITSFVAQLGIDLNLPADFDEREAYRKHLEEKYGWSIGEKKSRIDKGLEDIAAGRVHKAKNAEDMFKQILG